MASKTNLNSIAILTILLISLVPVVSTYRSIFSGTIDYGRVGSAAGYGAEVGAFTGLASIPMAGVFPKITKATSFIEKAAIGASYGASSLMAGSVAAQATSNVISGQPITDNVYEAAVGGAVVGGLAGAVFGGVSALKSSPTPKSTITTPRINNQPVKGPGGIEAGRFIVDKKGNVLIEPKGGFTKGTVSGDFITTYHPDGSPYQQYHSWHSNYQVPHGHSMYPKVNPKHKTGPKMDVYGGIVDNKAKEAHWYGVYR